MLSSNVASAASADRLSSQFVSPVFPKSRCSLWDKTPLGPPVVLHLAHYRKPRVCVPEKILKLVQHQCEHYGQLRHVLVGTLVVDDDGEGLQVQVDRLETRSNFPGSSGDLNAGCVYIYLQASNNAANERSASVDEYVAAIQNVQKRSCSKDCIDLCGFLHLFGWCSFYSSAHSSVVHVDFDMVSVETAFKSTPISTVPIAVTALSKNLASPRSLSNLQGVPKSGYLTMDQTRKLLLVLESDPKTAVLPLVGIWVSGVEFVHHPFVWAACIRFIYNTQLQDRVCLPPEEFLLVLYTPLHSRPEFYQCETSSGATSLDFELHSGHELINVDKQLMIPGNGQFLEVDLDPIASDSKKEIFNAAIAKNCNCANKNIGKSGQEDLEPRSVPTPHTEKVPMFRPLVPDVSILWTDSFDSSSNTELVPKHLDDHTMPCRPQGLSLRPQVSSQPFTTPGRLAGLNITPANNQVHRLNWQPSGVNPELSYHYTPSWQRISSPSNPLGFQLVEATTPQNPAITMPTPHSALSPNLGSTTVQQTVSSTYQNRFPGHNASNPGSANFASPALPPAPCSTPAPMSYINSTTDSFEGNNFSSNGHLGRSVAVNYSSAKNVPSMEAESRLSQSRQGFHQNVQGNNLNFSEWNYQHSPNQQSNIQQMPTPRNIQAQSHPHGPNNLTNVMQSHPWLKSEHVTNEVPATGQLTQPEPSALKNSINLRPTLKTITEEASISQISSLESHDSGCKSREPCGSPVRQPLTHNSVRSGVEDSVRSAAEDSGLSVTSDKLSTSLPDVGTPSLTSPASDLLSSKVTASTPNASPGSQTGMDNINWENIPSEIRMLLIQQSEQLRLLQQQIEVLQSQGRTPSMSNTCNLSNKVPADAHKRPEVSKYTSVGVNTTFLDHENKDMGSQKTCQGEQDHAKSNVCASSPKKNRSPAAVVKSKDPSPQQTPRDLSWNIRDLEEVMGDSRVFEPTVSPNVSTVAVSLPGYFPSVTDRSCGDQSQDTQDYSRQSHDESYLTLGADATDPKQYYSQLIRNIQMFLTNSQRLDSSELSPQAVQTHTQLSPRSAVETSLALSQTQSSTLQTSSTEFDNPERSLVVPDASSVSMFLGSGADKWQSMEINALAMKYLSDEQLTRVAKFRQLAPSSLNKPEYCTQILRHVVNGYKATNSDGLSTPDVSRFGMSPNDLTMGTRMYMEKHGLLGGDGSILEFSLLGQDLQLRTDFSFLTNESLVVPTNVRPVANERGKGCITTDHLVKSQSSPVRRASPAIETRAENDNENWLPVKKTNGPNLNQDLGPLPNQLQPLNNQAINQTERKNGHMLAMETNNVPQMNILQEVKPQNQIGKTKFNNDRQKSNEADKLLDIEMLKQLPKLL